MLSLDVAGLLKVGQDSRQKARYWLVVPPDELLLEREDEENEPEAEENRGDGDAFEEENPAEEHAEDKHEDDKEEGLREEDDLEEPGEDMELRVFRLGLVIPIPHKGARGTVKGAAEMMRLQAYGYQISRIHIDQGKEFRGRFQT